MKAVTAVVRVVQDRTWRPAFLVRNEKVDWFRVIVDLERAGLSIAAISAAIEKPKSTILRWKQGAYARYEDAVALIGLWSRVTGKSQDCVHVVNRYSYRA